MHADVCASTNNKTSMTTESAKSEIENKLATGLSKYMKDFSLTIEPNSFGGQRPMWKYSFSFQSTINGETKSATDGTEIGDTKSIIEWIWSALIDTAAASSDTAHQNKSHGRAYEELTTWGNAMGFATIAQSQR